MRAAPLLHFVKLYDILSVALFEGWALHKSAGG